MKTELPVLFEHSTEMVNMVKQSDYSRKTSIESNYTYIDDNDKCSTIDSNSNKQWIHSNLNQDLEPIEQIVRPSSKQKRRRSWAGFSRSLSAGFRGLFERNSNHHNEVSVLQFRNKSVNLVKT